MKHQTIDKKNAEILIEATKSSVLNMGFPSWELEERIYEAMKAHTENWSEGGLILLNGLRRAYKQTHSVEKYIAMMDRVYQGLEDH